MKTTFRITIVLLLLSMNCALGQNTSDTIHLKEVQIEGIRPMPYIKAVIKTSGQQEDNVSDIGDYIKSEPNVSGVRKGGTAIDPVLRGFRYSQLNVVLDDGIKIEGGCPNRMDPVTSHIETEEVQRIEITKGPFDLRYGPALGGVINLHRFKPEFSDTFRIHTQAFYGFETNRNGQREHLKIFGGGQRIAFHVSGGYKNYGHYRDGNETEVKSAFRKYNYSADLGIKLSKNQTLMLSVSETHGRNVRYPALPMDEVSDDTRISTASYQLNNISSAFRSVHLTLYHSSVNHIMDNSLRPTFVTMEAISEVDAFSTGGRAEAEIKAGKNLLKIGTDFELINKDGTKTATMNMVMGGLTTHSVKKQNLWNEAVISNAGIFAGYEFNIKSVHLMASARGDFNQASSGDTLVISKNGTDYFDKLQSQFINGSFSLTASKPLGRFFSVHLAAARGTRSPNMLERYIKFMSVGYDTNDYLGNPQLKPEVNNQGDVTLRFEKPETGAIYINGFYSIVQDFISAVKLAPVVAMPKTQGAPGVKQFVNINYVHVYGFEAAYKLPERSNLILSASVAYTIATVPEVKKYILKNNQVVGETVVNNDPLPEMPPLEGTLKAGYKLLQKKLVPYATLRVVADQRRVSDAFYENYTPGFALINLGISFKPTTFVQISGGVDNLLNRAYYEHLNRKITGSVAKLYEPGRVFFVNVIVTI